MDLLGLFESVKRLHFSSEYEALKSQKLIPEASQQEKISILETLPQVTLSKILISQLIWSGLRNLRGILYGTTLPRS